MRSPALTNPGNQSNYDLDAVNLALSASDSESKTLTYYATGLPSGLSINSSTGHITGTLASGGDKTKSFFRVSLEHQYDGVERHCLDDLEGGR